MRNLLGALGLLSILACAGCSTNTGPILPKGELTPEQIEKVKQEDRNIEDEESRGTVKRQP